MDAAVKASSRAARTPPWLRGARAAFAVLTRVPVGGFPYADDDWRWSAAYLPMVGALLGVAAATVWIACERAGHWVASIAAIVATLSLTGAMHEDGLADTADALGAGGDRKRILAILKDSRIGSYGAAALGSSLLLRAALLARLGVDAPWALVFAGAASRIAPVWLMATQAYVTDAAVAKSRSIAAAGPPQLIVAIGWLAIVGGALLASGVFRWLDLVVMVGPMIACALVSGAYFRSRVGGITGDFLGAAQQVSDVAMLLALALLRGGST